jgi:hypothetical protein
VVTYREIYAERTKRGGWKKATLDAWGVPWPPPRGWIHKLVAGEPIVKDEVHVTLGDVIHKERTRANAMTKAVEWLIMNCDEENHLYPGYDAEKGVWFHWCEPVMGGSKRAEFANAHDCVLSAMSWDA